MDITPAQLFREELSRTAYEIGNELITTHSKDPLSLEVVSLALLRFTVALGILEDSDIASAMNRGVSPASFAASICKSMMSHETINNSTLN
jgi:hypothetical protein